VYVDLTFSCSFVAEVNRVRGNLFHLNSAKDHMMLPDPVGPVLTLQEKLFVPVKDHPDVSIKSTICNIAQGVNDRNHSVCVT